MAERRPAVRVRHGIEDPDDLAWLRDVEDPEVMALLEAEAAHAEAVLAPLAPIVDRLYETIDFDRTNNRLPLNLDEVEDERGPTAEASIR